MSSIATVVIVLVLVVICCLIFGMVYDGLPDTNVLGAADDYKAEKRQAFQPRPNPQQQQQQQQQKQQQLQQQEQQHAENIRQQILSTGSYSREAQHQGTPSFPHVAGTQSYPVVGSTPFVPDGSLPPTSGANQNFDEVGSGLATSTPGASEVESAGVPAVCPHLILPNNEARFMIGMGALSRTSAGMLDVKGTSGRTLLSASIGEEGNRRCLQLASVNCERDPRTRILAPLPGAEGRGVLEVYGKQNRFYGTIEPLPGVHESTASARFLLRCGTRPVMIIEQHDLRDFAMEAFSMDRQRLGSAGRAPGEPGDNWKLTVSPGSDAILIVSCMLAMILLRPGGVPGTPLRGAASWEQTFEVPGAVAGRPSSRPSYGRPSLPGAYDYPMPGAGGSVPTTRAGSLPYPGMGPASYGHAPRGGR